MSATFSVLTKELQRLGLPLPDGTGPNGKILRADLEDSIADACFKSSNRSFNERIRLNLHSVQLAYRYERLTKAAQSDIFNDPRWVIEEKYDGARVVLIYNKTEGFGAFGRNRHRKTCLPINYSEKLLLPAGNDVQPGSFFAGKLKDLPDILKNGFILDCELIALNKLNVYSSSTLQSTVTSLLALNPQDSHAYQKLTSPLIPVLFDILPVDAHGNVNRSLCFYQRRELLESLYSTTPLLQNFRLAEQFKDNKQAILEKLIADGKEGVVFKNIDSLYTSSRCDYRSREVCVKLKRKLTDVRVSDIDAFIIGHTLGPAYTACGCIAGLKLGVYVKDDKGDLQQTHIATVCGIPMPLRQKMSRVNKDTQLPELVPDYMYKVVEVNGQDFSSLNKRIAHAIINWERGFRTDKSFDMCVLDADFIDSQIL